MARTLLTPVSLTQDDAVDAKAATVMTTIDATLVTAGMYLVMAKDDKIVLHVKNTFGTDAIVTVAAGTGMRAGIGALAVTVALTSGEQLIGPLESARFKQMSTGYLHIDFSTGMTGLIAAYKLP